MKKRGATKASIQDVDAGFLRPAQAAKYLGVSVRCLSQWQARRVVPFIKAGRKLVLFRRDDLDSAMNRFRQAAVGEGAR